MKLTFRSTDSNRKRYRQLLVEEWSRSTLVATRDYVLDLLKAAGLELHLTEDAEPDERVSLYPIPQSASEQLREHLESLNYNLRLEHEKTKELRLRNAEERRQYDLVASIAFLLAFPAWPLRQAPDGEAIRPVISGDTGLFDDARSILFLCAAYDLVPELEATRWHQLRGLLLQSLYTHASLAWHKHPAHQNYLFSVFFDSIGDEDRASSALQRAFLSTAPTEHDYFTRAFNYWSYEADRGHLDEAIGFALRLHREVPPELVNEAEELVRQSFALRPPRGTGSRGTGKRKAG